MARAFPSATAEQVVAVVGAVTSVPEPVRVSFVAEFSDLTERQAQGGLDLAADLGLVARDNQRYAVNSPLCQFVNTPVQSVKAAILRIVLESYEPFVLFRARLQATGQANEAAQQCRTLLQLDAHREEIRDTLVGLGTYSQALTTEGGGRYRSSDQPRENILSTLARACASLAAAEARTREQIGPEAAAIVSRDDVVVPIANAILRAKDGDPRGAVVEAGNAVESFLAAMGSRLGVAAVGGAPGINAKLDRLAQAGSLPSKILNMGKYLGHVRNAADHGADAEINAPWEITASTGTEYPFIACSFIAAAIARERGRDPRI